ncbi:hypothetical protein Ddc_03616 [Ditylenchus destructor]|nr:hypothetical protein Ddc_03616 [Ditylenchus destructor]
MLPCSGMPKDATFTDPLTSITAIYLRKIGFRPDPGFEPPNAASGTDKATKKLGNLVRAAQAARGTDKATQKPTQSSTQKPENFIRAAAGRDWH